MKFKSQRGYDFVVGDGPSISWNDPQTGEWEPKASNEAGSIYLPFDIGADPVVVDAWDSIVFGDRVRLNYLGKPYVWGLQMLGEVTHAAARQAKLMTRNLLQYPITTQEIVDSLERHLSADDQLSIGGIDDLCLSEAIRRVQEYDQLAKRADELVRNYTALNELVNSMADREILPKHACQTT